MSSITTVYDEILSNIQALFPSKAIIPYPYNLEDNKSLVLSNGIGVKIGSATYVPLEWCTFVSARNVSIVVSREVFRTDSDSVVIDDIVKGLLEDIHSVQKLLFQMDQTAGNSSSVVKVDIGNVSGVQIVGANTKFLTMEAEFTFNITDSL